MDNVRVNEACLVDVSQDSIKEVIEVDSIEFNICVVISDMGV